MVLNEDTPWALNNFREVYWRCYTMRFSQNNRGITLWAFRMDSWRKFSKWVKISNNFQKAKLFDYDLSANTTKR
jgi:hypothetical protein